MKQMRIPIVMLLLVFLASGLLLTGCGSTADSVPSASPSPTASAAPSASAAPTASAAPSASATPAATKAPAATPAPSASARPKATETPASAVQTNTPVNDSSGAQPAENTQQETAPAEQLSGEETAQTDAPVQTPADEYITVPDPSPTPHVHTVVVDLPIEATCRHPGKTEGSHCSECGEIITAQQTIPQTTHMYVRGVCIWCGAHSTMPGDDEGIILPPM